jgi:fucose permease
MVVVFIIGLGLANVFPLIYSLTVEQFPHRSNEISGLMIMAVSGGAVLPPLMGVVTDTLGNVSWGMMVLLLSAAYLLFISVFNQKQKTNY